MVVFQKITTTKPLNQNKMTHKEKAQELVEWAKKYGASNEVAKLFAIKIVDEILEMDLPILEEEADIFYDYWTQVKQEIEKL